MLILNKLPISNSNSNNNTNNYSSSKTNINKTFLYFAITFFTIVINFFNKKNAKLILLILKVLLHTLKIE